MTEQSCTCPFTDPATWTTHYGAVEPGSTQEYDPTCPVHGALRAEVEALRAVLEGRCMADITLRDEGHRQAVCVLAKGHTTAHDDALGCTWTDADHWQPSERDDMAARIARVEALHVEHAQPCSCTSRMFRGECFEMGLCHACRHEWPCPTIGALRGESE